MDISGLNNSNGPAPVAQKPKTDERQMSIGENLNRMAGVQNQKSLYAPKQEMGKEQFLKLFMEQLKYQDPLNPVKNENFNQQMAMFSQLEQAINMNKTLEKMAAGQNNNQVAALQLVGKNIVANRGTLYHEKDKFTAMNFKLPQDVKEMRIDIKDGAGEVVRSYSLDSRNQGDVTWKWDGNNEQGAPVESGKYTYDVRGKGVDGKEVKVDSKIDGRVTGVTSAAGVVFLVVGDQKIGLNDVELIKEVPVESANKMANPLGAAPQAAPVQVAAADVPKPSGTESESKVEEAKEDDGRGDRLRGTLSSDRLNLLMPLNMR
jgi:flagellar basal-body rod modification protein FlgD